MDKIVKNNNLTTQQQQKGHSENLLNSLNHWYLTTPKISTEPPFSPLQFDNNTYRKYWPILTEAVLKIASQFLELF